MKIANTNTDRVNSRMSGKISNLITYVTYKLENTFKPKLDYGKL